MCGNMTNLTRDKREATQAVTHSPDRLVGAAGRHVAVRWDIEKDFPHPLLLSVGTSSWNVMGQFLQRKWTHSNSAASPPEIDPTGYLLLASGVTYESRTNKSIFDTKLFN